MPLTLEEADQVVAGEAPTSANRGLTLEAADRMAGLVPQLEAPEEPLGDIERARFEVERLGQPRLRVPPMLGPPRALATAPPVMPAPPSQAEVMARPPGQLDAEAVLRGGTVDLPPTEEESPPISAAPLLPRSLAGLKRGVVEGAATGLPGLALQAVDPHLFEAARLDLPSAEEEPESLTEQAVRAVVSLADPVTAATFLLTGGFGAASIKGGINALVAKFGEASVRQGLRTAATRMGGGGTAFAAYDAARDALEQAGAVGRGEQEKVEPGRVLEAAGRGALVGVPMGVATLPTATLLRKAAEVGVLATVPPVLEGRAPSSQDVLDAGVLVGALTVAGRLQAGAAAALRKPRPQRTPEEQQAVEAIPEEAKAEIARQVDVGVDDIFPVRGAAATRVDSEEIVNRGLGPRMWQIIEGEGHDPEEIVEMFVAEIKKRRLTTIQAEMAVKRFVTDIENSLGGEINIPVSISKGFAEEAQNLTQEAVAPPQAEEVAPSVAEAVQRAEAAAQRARDSLARMEELAARPLRPEPLEGQGAALEPPPPETQPAPGAKPQEPEGPSVPPATAGEVSIPQPARPAEILPAGRIAEAAPEAAAPGAEVRPTGAELAPPEGIPQTFRAFVESKGRRWPVTVRDPGYAELRQEYDALRRPRYEKRGVEVVETRTGQVVGTWRNGAEAQLLANRLNAGRGTPQPLEAEKPPTLDLSKPLNVLKFVQEQGGLRPGSEGWTGWLGVPPQAMSPTGLLAEEMVRRVSDAVGRSVTQQELVTTLRGLAQARSQGGVKGKETRLAREQAIDDVELAKVRMRDDLIQTFTIYPNEDPKGTIFFVPDLQRKYGGPQTALTEIFNGDRAEMDRVVAEAKQEAVRQTEAEFGAGNRLVTREQKDAAAQRIKDKYPGVQLQQYDTYSACVEALKTGAIDAVTTPSRAIPATMSAPATTRPSSVTG